MMERETYSDVRETKLRLGKLEGAYLRAQAAQHGISLSEMTRRIVAERMARHEEQGKDTPDPAPVPPDPSLVIEVVRNERGRPVVHCPGEFSAGLQSAILATLSRHVAEFEDLLPVRDEQPPHNGDSEGTNSAEKG